MENFLGSWLLEKNEKFTDFLHCLGVPYLVCKFANWLPTTINICQEADEYTIETVTTFKTTKARFKPDEPFEETSMGDTNLKSLIRLENGVLHYQQSGKKEVNSKWEVNGETLNVPGKRDTPLPTAWKKEINGMWTVDEETLNDVNGIIMQFTHAYLIGWRTVLTVEDVVCRRTYKRVE